MKILSYYHQNSDSKIFTYNKQEIDEIKSVLSNKLNLDDLINEYNVTTDGDRSLTEVFKKRVFSVLESELNFIFTKKSTGEPGTTDIVSSFKHHRLNYNCKKENYYLTYTTDNRGFIENKLFKNLLIVDQNPKAVPIILTIGENVREFGAWNKVILTYEVVMSYLNEYKNHIDIPFVLLGIFKD